MSYSARLLVRVAALAGVLVACDDDPAATLDRDAQLRDVGPVTLGDQFRPLDDAGLDAAIDERDRDQGTTPDMTSGDQSTTDMAPLRLDRSPGADAAPDLAPPMDMAPPLDLAPPIDMEPPPIDMAPPPVDMAPIDVPPGQIACRHGPGWSLVALHYDDGSTSPRVDHWGASCDYSIRLNDRCGLIDRCRGAVGCQVGRTDTGAVELDGTDDLVLWFQTAGLPVAGDASLHLLGRALCPAAPTRFQVADPLNGWAVEGGPVGQQFEYQWHTVPLAPLVADQALVITAGQGCGRLGVQAVEVCVE